MQKLKSTEGIKTFPDYPDESNPPRALFDSARTIEDDALMAMSKTRDLFKFRIVNALQMTKRDQKEKNPTNKEDRKKFLK